MVDLEHREDPAVEDPCHTPTMALVMAAQGPRGRDSQVATADEVPAAAAVVVREEPVPATAGANAPLAVQEKRRLSQEAPCTTQAEVPAVRHKELDHRPVELVVAEQVADITRPLLAAPIILEAAVVALV